VGSCGRPGGGSRDRGQTDNGAACRCGRDEQRELEAEEAIGAVVTDERKPELELKVVGMTVEEALERVERFLDSALLTGTPWVRIIHGHGTGALRRAISAYLKDLPFVSAWGTAEPEAGGEAVTVVEFGE